MRNFMICTLVEYLQSIQLPCMLPPATIQVALVPRINTGDIISSSFLERSLVLISASAIACSQIPPQWQ